MDKYLIWLTHLYDIGISGINLLLDTFKTPAQIYNTKDKDFRAHGIPYHIINKIAAAKKNVDPDTALEYMAKRNIGFIAKEAPEYPAELITIDEAPIGLFVIGSLPDDGSIKISVIGTRKCSDYGKSAAWNLSRELAQKGVVIVSGMAEGIDSMAHKGCLSAGGQTVAVMAGGVDVCYPPGNRELYEKICENGAIISEIPPKTGVRPWLFPKRNRIISGLSPGVLLVEAPMKSGALITADFALNQGREVLCVPGGIFSKQSQAPNALIKDGAFPITKAQDVFDALGIFEDEQIQEAEEKTDKDPEKIGNTITPDESLIYNCIGPEPVALDEILSKTDIKIQIAQYILTNLEMAGKIRKLPGSRYIKA